MISLPLKTVNALNTREHWSKRARRAKRDRALGYIVTPAGLKPPLTITLTRIHPKRYVMDTDGLSACFKGLRDGIADKLGVDDGSPLLTWRYEQIAAKEYGVTIDIKGTDPAPIHSATASPSEDGTA